MANSSLTISTSEKNILPELYGLRAISILMVITYHLQLKYHLFEVVYQNKYYFLYPFIALITDGHLGVNVFFVISGFLITSILLEEEKRSKTVSLKKFYFRRILRIFPAYYFLLFILFILQKKSVLYISPDSWLTALTYTKYINWHLDWFTAHAWSLSIEEQFYLLFPFLFLAGDKLRKGITIFLVLVVPLIRIYYHYYPIFWMNDLTLFQRMDSIATGCFVAFYRSTLLTYLRPRFKILFLASVIGIFALYFVPLINLYVNHTLNFLIIPLGLTHGTLANIFIAVILLYSVYGEKRKWHHLLNAAPFYYIGLWSYSLYLWQQLFLSGLNSPLTQWPQNILYLFFCSFVLFLLYLKAFFKA